MTRSCSSALLSGLRPSRARAAARHPAGYVLISVLVAMSIMAGFVVAYGRHVIVDGRGGMASPELIEAREACHSGLAFVRQSLASGQRVASATVPAGTCSADVNVSALPGGHQSIELLSLDSDGAGARRLAELALVPTPASNPDGPIALPQIDEQLYNALVADPTIAITHVTSSQRIEGAELSGLVVVHPDVELQLDDVVLTGALVSAAVLDPSGVPSVYEAAHAPTVLIDGNVRIDPGAAFPGVAILMPDGAVQSGALGARVQIHGDVVAHDLTLLHSGVLGGNAAAVELVLADDLVLDRLDANRKPAPWSPSLQLGGTQQPLFLALVPSTTSLDALAPIIEYWN